MDQIGAGGASISMLRLFRAMRLVGFSSIFWWDLLHWFQSSIGWHFLEDSFRKPSYTEAVVFNRLSKRPFTPPPSVLRNHVADHNHNHLNLHLDDNQVKLLAKGESIRQLLYTFIKSFQVSNICFGLLSIGFDFDFEEFNLVTQIMFFGWSPSSL